ncbi:SpaA isopeptide-forming pilin-related protein [Enterococcus sp. DIV0187]|uniref:SpaA isopeptide-forming pilin-related protein n=1 Tax=Enterococcus sp. DIV0187 TaxID=2774644 RepID=UPI003F26A1A6
MRNLKKTVTIFLPIILLLGVVTAVAAPRGGILKAFTALPPLVDLRVEDEEVTKDDFKVEKDEIEIELTAKEKETIKLPYNGEYEVVPLDKKGKEISAPIYHKDRFKEEIMNKDKTVQSFQIEEASEAIEQEKQRFINVETVFGKGFYYLNMEKDQKQRFRIRRNASKKVEVKIVNAEDQEHEQKLFTFPEIKPLVKEEAPKESNTTEESIHTSEEADKTITSETKKAFQPKDTKQSTETSESKDVDSKKITETSESKTEEKDVDKTDSKEKASEKNEPENYAKVLAVETKETKKSLKELEDADYKSKDSLKKPQMFGTLETKKSTTKATKETKAASPIIVKDVSIPIKTGTTSFDEGSGNKPGYDENEENEFVRSFDQVSYLVSFSIQNTEFEERYTDIRYRVISELPNAITLVGGKPRYNGEIGNGTLIDKPGGSAGEKISQGVMESVISDSGQVFVPVIVNIFGAAHDTRIKPSFKLEIVDATNVKTGKTETFNEIFDNIPNDKNENKLDVKETKVSAKPSVVVRLTQGEIKPSSSGIYSPASANIDAYNVGITTVLEPIDADRREKKDYRGSTFPDGAIKYQIKEKATYQIGTNATQSMPDSQRSGFWLTAHSVPEKDRTAATWTQAKATDISKLQNTLNVPKGKSEKIYTDEPPGDHSEIGVYDSGKFTVNSTASNFYNDITNTDYVGVLNPYTYTMTGKRTQSATDKVFSSMEAVFYWDRTKTATAAVANKWSRYDMVLYVDAVQYADGRKDSFEKPSSVTYPTVVATDGDYRRAPAIGVYSNNVDSNTHGSLVQAVPGVDGNLNYNYGKAQLALGQKAVFIDYTSLGGSHAAEAKISEHIQMWDPTGFEYDTSRTPTYDSWTLDNLKVEYQYGVAKNLGTSPPYTMQVPQVYAGKNLYNWYNTPEAAIASGGKISAVYTKATFDLDHSAWAGKMQTGSFVPVKVIASGNKTPAGNSFVHLACGRFSRKDSTLIRQAPSVGNNKGDDPKRNDLYGQVVNYIGRYGPTNFTSSGAVTSTPMIYYNFIGESAFVKPFLITTKTEIGKPLYQSDEDIDIKLTGVLSGDDSIKYGAALTTTLPKGISYKQHSSLNGKDDSPLPEPTSTGNSNGTTTLRWDFEDISLKDGNDLTIKFKATSDFTQLKFKDSGYTDALEVKTVGDMWTAANPNIKDDSPEPVRSSKGTFIEHLIQQVILSKTTTKPSIEVGNKDPRPSGEDTSIMYKIRILNESAAPIPGTKILDVLPYNGDSRGTTFKGSYNITDLKVSDPSVVVNFSNSVANESADPNKVMNTGTWNTFISGTDSVTKIQNAKSIVIDKDILDVGEEIEIMIKIQPVNQQPGDVLINNAGMNSELNLPVSSQTAITRVYGRKLTGYVWYDDDYNGLIGAKKDGTPEDPVANIPVKLYRTSYVDGSYANKLVEKDLLGNTFNVKTDANGKYEFNNLPEGKYVAEFVVNDLVIKKVFIVTQQLIGSDASKNSKASQTADAVTKEYQTPDYKLPTLNDLPGILTGADKVHLTQHVNAGLTRLSEIRLFKYEEGSAIDENNDGKLSEAEIEKAKPLAGATFDIYKGNSTAEKDKIGSGTTDSSGWLKDTDKVFSGLLPGDYTLVETKAPAGYELLKEPIRVNVPTYNHTVKVHVPNNDQTKLPFTGGTKAMRFILIGAASLLVIGMVGVFLHFRPTKVRVKGGK